MLRIMSEERSIYLVELWLLFHVVGLSMELNVNWTNVLSNAPK